MKTIRISDMAANYVRSERAYLASYSSGAAAEFGRKLRSARSLLQSHPDVGKIKPGTNGVRLLVMAPYIIEYEVTVNHILILIIRHGRQDEETLHRLPEEDDLF